ncbi:MAG: orotidine-5'-phosphate decarboxylase [Candidatus Diapherotrites archaeon]
MNYVKFLKNSAMKFNSIACVGFDPQLEKIEKVCKAKNTQAILLKFYSDILNAMRAEGTMPAAIKPNYAFFAQYGFDGLRALKKVIKKVKMEKIPCILDAKRGDIGSTSGAYAKEVFDFWKADCVTIAPYMGSDSVGPFIKYSEEKGRGVYILNRTSNKGAADLQNLMIEGKPLYLKTAEKIIEWSANAKGNVGAVVGATSIQELKELSAFYSSNKNFVPLLIPGVGSQGGSAKEVKNALKENNYDISIVRINSSSAINYAFEKDGSQDYVGAAVKALKELNKEIEF